ncbi:MAG: SufE family protein [Chitinivibrionales bacterium]|nr:SufE family protein [Chitinivibrionales bacterium]MBD3357218.1 SufE family protein [Chitinivibrionales bacterium]
MTINRIQDAIIEEFSNLDDWFDKYEYLVRIAKTAPASDGTLRTEAYALKGCQAKVWLRAEMNRGKLHITADSDSTVTRGILALLIRVLDNQSPRDVARANLYFLDGIGLSTGLSPGRANGLAAIIKTLKDTATRLDSPEAASET